MADNLGQQVAAEILELGKSTAKATVKAGSDVLQGGIESLSTGQISNSSHKSGDSLGEHNQIMMKKQQNERKRRRRLEEVKEELNRFRQRQLQQRETEKRQQVQQQQVKEEKKQQHQSWLGSHLAKLKRQGGGSGEALSSKN